MKDFFLRNLHPICAKKKFLFYFCDLVFWFIRLPILNKIHIFSFIFFYFRFSLLFGYTVGYSKNVKKKRKNWNRWENCSFVRSFATFSFIQLTFWLLFFFCCILQLIQLKLNENEWNWGEKPNSFHQKFKLNDLLHLIITFI